MEINQHEETGVQSEILDISIETKDGLKLHGWNLAALPPVIANVIIIHGMKDHSCRYEDFARRLTQTGFNVFGLDLRGHAHSEGERVYFESNELLMNDLERAFDAFMEVENGMPWFLFGHSAGGSLAARYVVDHPDDFSGFILSAPLLKRSKDIGPLTEAALRLINKFTPKFGVVDLKDIYFSSDPKVIEEIRNSPLIHNIRIPARTAVGFLDNIDYVMKSADQIRRPCLVLHSQADKINPVEGSREFFATAGRNIQSKLKLYRDLQHDLFHEPDHEKVENDVMNWLMKIVSH